MFIGVTKVFLAWLLVGSVSCSRRTSRLRSNVDLEKVLAAQSAAWGDGPLDLSDDDDLAPLAVTQKPFVGLQVGTHPAQADIVQNGLVNSFYSNAGPRGEATPIRAIGKPTQFFISLSTSATTDTSKQWRTPHVKVRALNASLMTAHVKVGKSARTRHGNLVSKCEVNVACHAPGDSRIRVALREDSSRISPVFFLDRVCRNDVLQSFNIGTEPGGSDAVKHGVAQWLEPSLSRVVGPGVSELTLHLSIKDGGSAHTFEPLKVRAYGGAAPSAFVQLSSGPRDEVSSAGDGTVALVEASTHFASGSLAFNQPGTIRLRFQCVRFGYSVVELELSPAPVYQPYGPVKLYLTKVCGGEHRPGFRVGTGKNLSDLILDGKVVGKAKDVSGLAASSRFFLKVEREADEPSALISEEPKANVHCEPIGGHEGGRRVVDAVVKQVSMDEATGERLIDVSYDCRQRGEAICSLVFDFRIWKPVQLQWHKQCGGHGGARPDVVIQSDLEKFLNVFGDGHAANAWSPLHPVVYLLEEEDDVTFTVHKKAGNSVSHVVASDVTSLPVVLRGINATSDNPDVLEFFFDNESDWLSRVLSSPTDVATIHANHLCKKKGKVNVTLKIFLEEGRSQWPMRALHSQSMFEETPLFEPISFSYMKQCHGLPASITYIAFAAWFGMCSVSAACMGCMVKNKAKPWEEPPPSDA